MPAVRLNLFGVPTLDQQGSATPLMAERLTQMAVVLALRGDWVTRDQVAGLLWSAATDAAARRDLRKVLFRARAKPWFGPIESRADALRWSVASDVRDFEASCAQENWTQAVALYGGELCKGFENKAPETFAQWLHFERNRLAALYRLAAARRMTQLGGDAAAREALARRWLVFDPLDEEALAALVDAARAQGHDAEAKRALDGFAQRLAQDVGVEPTARVRSLVVVAPAVVPANVGRVDEDFVGRLTELLEVQALLAREECRLLTVTGPGGVGKSCLVKQVLRQLGSRAETLWIALDDLSDTAQALARIAAELHVTAERDPLHAVCARLGSRRVLMVLDNCEHLVGLARLIERLLAEAPGVKICATSRVRLGVVGEWLLPLHGLDLPAQGATAGELLASDAARLFVAKALAVKPDYDTTAQARAIGELVRAVGGMPLAILLAANWARLLPVAGIAAELAFSLDLLESADEGEERPEHRSVRATFAQSWQMLAPAEQHALAALSVFAGTFSVEAARSIAGASLPVLAALVDKSMLQVAEDRRWSLHPLIRQFAAEALSPDVAADVVRRHAEWFHLLLARLRSPAEAADTQAIGEIEKEMENFRLAWRWAVAHEATAVLAGSALTLMRFFESRARAEEGLALLSEALPLAALTTTPPLHAADLHGAIGQLQYRLGRLDAAAASVRQGLKHARVAVGRGAIVRCLNVLGLCHWHWGRHKDAKRILEQSLRLAQAARDARAAAIALGNLAAVEQALGDYARARELMLEALARQRELGDWVGAAVRLNSLAHLHQSRGELAQARAFLDEGLALCNRHAIEFVRPHLLVNLAITFFFLGDFDQAEQIGRQTLAAARASHNANVEATALLHLVRVAVKRRDAATARADLHAALTSARTMGNLPMQLDAVFCFAEILAAEGDNSRAAALMRYFAGRSEVEPADRAIAQASLDGLAVDAVAPIETPLDVLLERILVETATATAQRSGAIVNTAA